jgi:hypothetical protein
MTDEARIERLTELARKVWPDFIRLRVRGAPSPDERTASRMELVVETKDFYRVVLAVDRRLRALEALEAALLVLAGEVTLAAIERASLPQSGPWPSLREAEEKLRGISEIADDPALPDEQARLLIAAVIDDRAALPPEDR